VMEYLRAKHFTVDGFLKGLFEAREDGYLRQWTAAKKVMYTDAEIVQTLTNDEQATFLETTEWSPVRRIFRREMLTLTRTPQFGKFNPEDCRTPIEALMNETELQRLAPHLIGSIYQACEPIRLSTRKNPHKMAAMVLSMMSFCMQRQKSNFFALNLGIFLHKEGLSRSGIETLSCLGIISSYDTIRNTLATLASTNKEEVRKVGEAFSAVVIYDNVNFANKVQDLRDGDTSKFISATTGLVHAGYRMPPQGLTQNLFNPRYTLKTNDILPEGLLWDEQERRRSKVRQNNPGL